MSRAARTHCVFPETPKASHPGDTRTNSSTQKNTIELLYTCLRQSASAPRRRSARPMPTADEKAGKPSRQQKRKANTLSKAIQLEPPARVLPQRPCDVKHYHVGTEPIPIGDRKCFHIFMPSIRCENGATTTEIKTPDVLACWAVA